MTGVVATPRVASALAALVVLVVLPIIGVVGPAATSSAALSLRGFEDMMVDDARGHIFVSTGDSVVVTDLDLTQVGTIEGLSGADGLAFSPDNSTLYVGRSDEAVISAIDTETFAVTDHPTPGRCPETLAPVDGVIWFSGHRSCTNSGVSALDLATGNVTDHPERYYESVVATTPARPGLVAVAEVHTTGSYLELFQSGDVEGVPTLVPVARRFIGLIGEVAFTPDGDEVLTAGGDGVQRFSTVDLTPVGPTYDAGNNLTPLTFADDGSLAIGRAVFDPDVYVPRTVIWLPDRGIMGSAWVGERLLAVTRDYETESVYRLEQMDLRPKSRVTITGPRGVGVVYGEPLALALTLETASTENRVVDLYARRVDGEEHLVRSVEVGTEGRTIELTAHRSLRFRAVYRGDEHALPDAQGLSQRVYVRVQAHPVGGHSVHGIDGLTEYAAGEPARVRGHIAPLRAGRRLTVILAVKGPYIYEEFERWRTRADADGRFRVRVAASHFDTDGLYTIYVRHAGTEELAAFSGWSGPFRYAR